MIIVSLKVFLEKSATKQINGWMNQQETEVVVPIENKGIVPWIV